MSDHGPMIECENLLKIYKADGIEVVALQGLDLTIGRAELCAIIGPSGSGKSSLLNVLGGLDTPTAGRALVDGRDLLKMTQSDRLAYRRETVGFVWQNVGRNLIPYLSAQENVEAPMILAGRFDRKRASQLLELVGLGHRMHHPPSRMSGGEQQRVAIAIGLANTPSVLLADEPTGNVDTANTANILRVLHDVRTELGVTVIIVTHDQSLAASVDRYVAISDGKTSTESVRRGGSVSFAAMPEFADPSATLSFEEEGEQAGESHDHYVLLDSAGRLQLSEEIREKYGIAKRVRLIEEEGRIVLERPEAEE
ncbi:MAG: ABC transporter ATP-binding protein [Spirochaetota bacterium]